MVAATQTTSVYLQTIYLGKTSLVNTPLRSVYSGNAKNTSVMLRSNYIGNTPTVATLFRTTYTGSSAFCYTFFGKTTTVSIDTRTPIMYGVPSTNIWMYVQIARQYLADFPETNEYVNEPYVGDKTLITALNRLLDIINTTGVPVTQYTLDTLPNKELLFGEGLLYVIYNLLYQVEMRNSTDVNLPTGVQVSSARKASMYQQYSNQYYQIFYNHLTQWKHRLNVSSFTEDW